MLVPFDVLLEDCRARGAALSAFTAYDLETAGGVLAAAEETRRPVVLLISREAFVSPGGDGLMVSLRSVVERSVVRCCLQLDHVSDLAVMERALELGCGAVMADGSKLPRAENARLVEEAVALAARFGAHVEAELGHVAGGEDVAEAARDGQLTSPEDAALFARETGTDCLAVSIGNVHGFYRALPELDWTRLSAIREATALPLSLHGASGLPDEDVRRAIDLGISKVNVNTELREAYMATTSRQLAELHEGLRLLELHKAQREAVRVVAARKLALLTGALA